MRNLIVVLLAAVAVAACSSAKPPVPGKMCTIKSDCTDPLSCSFGRCHEACRDDGDCPGEQRCVWNGPANAPGSLRLCLLDPMCALDSTCPDPLVCGRDLKCRNECEADRDCARRGDRCVPGGLVAGQKVCAEPESVTDAGVLVSAPDAGAPDGGGAGGGAGGTAPQDGGGGAGGAGGGTGGAPATDAGSAADTAFDSGAGGAAADAGQPDVAADAAPDAAPDAAIADATLDAASDGGGSDAFVGQCGSPELEPNNTTATALPYTIGVPVIGCSTANADPDYYRVITPATPAAGGFFRGTVYDIGAGPISIQLVSSTDNGPLWASPSVSFTNGLTRYFYWAASPGQTYFVDVYRQSVGLPPFLYTLRVDYVPVEDPYEPNDDRDHAAHIELGAPVTAYLFTGFKSSALANAEYQDWYQVDVAAGPVRVLIESVPLDLNLRFRAYNTVTNLLASSSGSTSPAGAVVNGTFTAPTAGTYWLLVDSTTTGVSNATEASQTIPDSFTRPYRLTVTQ